MKIRRFKGKDMREALTQVKEELGGDAVIMSNRQVDGGVELMVAVDKDTEASAKQQRQQLLQEAVSESVEPIALAESSGDDQLPSLSDIMGDSVPDSIKALLNQKATSAPASEQDMVQANNSVRHLTTAANVAPKPEQQQREWATDRQPVKQPQPSVTASDPEFETVPDHPAPSSAPEPAPGSSIAQDSTAATAPTATVNDATGMSELRAEIAGIKQVLQFQITHLLNNQQRQQDPIKSVITEQLVKMGLDEALATQISAFLPKQENTEIGFSNALELLTNRLSIMNNDILTRGGVVALMGPTGTGKTTTLAKLAAKFARRHGADSIGLVTIDTYRIGAMEQLSTYAKIIGCSVKQAHNADELSHILYQFRHKKLVLVDTAGFSQRDERLISQITDYEQRINLNIDKYLVLQASAQRQVLEHTIHSFANTTIKGCIFTKLDECYSLGETLSVAVANDLRIGYVTDGQRVPDDIKLADSHSLIKVAAKLYQKYVKHGTPLTDQGSLLGNTKVS